MVSSSFTTRGLDSPVMHDSADLGRGKRGWTVRRRRSAPMVGILAQNGGRVGTWEWLTRLR